MILISFPLHRFSHSDGLCAHRNHAAPASVSYFLSFFFPLHLVPIVITIIVVVVAVVIFAVAVPFDTKRKEFYAATVHLFVNTNRSFAFCAFHRYSFVCFFLSFSSWSLLCFYHRWRPGQPLFALLVIHDDVKECSVWKNEEANHQNSISLALSTRSLRPTVGDEFIEMK